MSGVDLTEKQKARQTTYKTGLSVEGNRRNRDEATSVIRKQKKQESLAKRRQIPVNSAEDEELAQQVGLRTTDSGIEFDQFGTLVDLIRSSNTSSQLDGTIMFRRVLTIERNPPIELVLAHGIHNVFIGLLDRHDTPQLQFEAAWALTNIASNKPEYVKALIESGAVPPLVNLLASPNKETREQAMWALGNIAGDSVDCRDFCLSMRMLDNILAAVTEPEVSLSTVRTGAWCISNLVRGKPAAPWLVVQPALRVLAQLIFHADDAVLADAMWALAYMSDGDKDRIQALVEIGVCRRVVELLLHHKNSVQIPSLRVVGNMVTGNDVHTQVVLNCSVLPCLYRLLNSDQPNLRKEACWTVSNIAAGTAGQVKAVIDANLVPTLVEIMSTSEFFKTRKEATWAINNLTIGGTAAHIRYLVTQKVIKPLCDLLTVSDPRVILIAMNALENILKVGEIDKAQLGYNPYRVMIEQEGGADKLDLLQHHESRDIFERVQAIIARYFMDGGPDDQNVAPAVGSNGTFGFNANLPATNFSF